MKPATRTIGNKYMKKDDQKCCCLKFFNTMISNTNRGICKFCTKPDYCRIPTRNISTQTNGKSLTEHETKSLTEIKQLLNNINTNLGSILLHLKEKKDSLYDILNKENIHEDKHLEVLCNKSERMKSSYQIRNALVHLLPDISRLHYYFPTRIQSPKHCYKLIRESNILLYPRTQQNAAYYTQPNSFSCPDINYVQIIRELSENSRKKSITPFSPLGFQKTSDLKLPTEIKRFSYRNDIILKQTQETCD